MTRKNTKSAKSSKSTGSRQSRSRIAKMVKDGSARAEKDAAEEKDETDDEEEDDTEIASNSEWKADREAATDDHAAGDDFDAAMDDARKNQDEDRKANEEKPAGEKAPKAKKERAARAHKNERIAGTPDSICGMPVPPSGKPCVLAPGHAKGHSCHSDHAKDADRAIRTAARLLREYRAARNKVEDIAIKMGTSTWEHYALTRGFALPEVSDVIEQTSHKQVEKLADEQSKSAE